MIDIDNKQTNPINLDIVLISYNTVNLLKNCLDSLLRILQTCLSIEGHVYMVDNASKDKSVDFVRKNYPNVTIIVNNANLGYSKAVNIGINAGSSPYILVINSDLEFKETGIDKFISYMSENEDIGIMAPQLVSRDGSWQNTYGYEQGISASLKKMFGIWELVKWKAKRSFKLHNAKTKNVEFVQGAIMLIRRSMVEIIGGFDEDFFFYAEDVEFCHRARSSGYRVVFFPQFKVMHLKGGSSPDFLLSLQKCLTSDSQLIRKIHPGYLYSLLYSIIEFTISYIRYLVLQLIPPASGVQWRNRYKGIMELYLTYYGYFSIANHPPNFGISKLPNKYRIFWQISAWLTIFLIVIFIYCIVKNYIYQ
jgi:GT2 family glycosyltransferase